MCALEGPAVRCRDAENMDESNYYYLLLLLLLLLVVVVVVG